MNMRANETELLKFKIEMWNKVKHVYLFSPKGNDYATQLRVPLRLRGHTSQPIVLAIDQLIIQ